MDISGETINNIKEAADAVYEPKYAVPRVAGFLNISVTSVWRLIWEGKLKSYQFSGRTLVGQKHLKEYIEKSERGGAG